MFTADIESSLNHTESTLVAVAPQHIATILKLSSRIPQVKAILAMTQLPEESKKIYQAWGEQVGIKIYDLPQSKSAVLVFGNGLITLIAVEELGKANLKKPVYPSSDAIATICYTSVCNSLLFHLVVQLLNFSLTY